MNYMDANMKLMLDLLDKGKVKPILAKLDGMIDKIDNNTKQFYGRQWLTDTVCESHWHASQITATVSKTLQRHDALQGSNALKCKPHYLYAYTAALDLLTFNLEHAQNEDLPDDIAKIIPRLLKTHMEFMNKVVGEYECEIKDYKTAFSQSLGTIHEFLISHKLSPSKDRYFNVEAYVAYALLLKLAKWYSTNMGDRPEVLNKIEVLKRKVKSL